MKAQNLHESKNARMEKAAEWCVRLSGGDLLPDEQEAFQAWLDQDAENKKAFDQVEASWRQIEVFASAPEILAMRGAALETMRQAYHFRWVRAVWASPRRVAAIAAVLVLSVMGAGAWLHYTPRTFETGIGERRVAILADGSKISLDSDSVVKVLYTDGKRRLWLDQGRAKFDVAKDPLRPFSVAAANKLVVATGTQFSVEILRKQLRVVLYEGHVSVLRKESAIGSEPEKLVVVRVGQDKLPAEQVLEPGHELIVPETSAAARLTASDPARSLSWEAGKLTFYDEPLVSAIERVNRYSDEEIVIGDSDVGNIKISGLFDAGDMAAFVNGVTTVFPVRSLEREGKVVLMLRRSAPSSGIGHDEVLTP